MSAAPAFAANHPPDLTAVLAAHPLFGPLDAQTRQQLADQMVCQRFDAGALLAAQGALSAQTGLVLQGAVAVHDPDLGHLVQLGAGSLFGAGATPTAQLATWQAVAASACDVAWIAPAALQAACAAHPALAYHLPSLPAVSDARSLQDGNSDLSLNLLSTPIRTLIKRSPITLPPSTPIQQAAQVMREKRVSSVLLVEREHLFGLVTDRDLRNRVVAPGLDTARPIADIATLAPLTVDASSPAFEALLMMARHNIHHLPVMDGPRIAGMITATDLTEQHSTSAVYLAGDIYKQTHIEGLTQISGKVRQLQQNLAAAKASAYSTGHIITAITDALTIRLLHLAEAKFGPAPVDYVWVAAGSQARSEQTAKSDQDNCMVLNDAYDATLHGDYFRDLSRFVCDGLDACGYIHCPGEMMAMTDKWRQPRKQWEQYFTGWIDRPEPMALMLTCVFFDLRAIHGKTELLDTLRADVLRRTQGNSLFLAHMVSNALKHRPPLGMFGNISLIRGGENPGTIDLKHTGIVPIVDLARVYALSGGIAAVNTQDRLEASGQSGEISAKGARDLRDALEFLAGVRIAHQARQMQLGQAPDNFLALDELSNFERSQLKQAFGVVQTLQGVLGSRYQGGSH